MNFNFYIFKAASLRWATFYLLVACIIVFCGKVFAVEDSLSIARISAVALKAKYAELNEQLRHNQFQRELYLISSESQHDLKGEIYAVVNYPFSAVSQALNNPDHWCDALILHVNIKYCHAAGYEANTVLNVNLGKKDQQELASTYRIALSYQEMMRTSDYFAVELKAANGPLSTSDYHIWIEATPLKDGRTFLHFTYSYAFGIVGRLAIQSYLATGGRNKVGFTISDKLVDNQPVYIKGVRGIVERNTMRYYLAIDAYLSALNSLPKDQLEQRSQQWFNSTEQYAVQLHEVERNDYLEMKRNEYKRQQVAQ